MGWVEIHFYSEAHNCFTEGKGLNVTCKSKRQGDLGRRRRRRSLLTLLTCIKAQIIKWKLMALNGSTLPNKCTFVTISENFVSNAALDPAGASILCSVAKVYFCFQTNVTDYFHWNEVSMQ